MRTMKTFPMIGLPFLALMLAGCASTGGARLQPDQALFRVENDYQDAFAAVSLETVDGDFVPLGRVRPDGVHDFAFQLPEGVHQYRLVARIPDTLEGSDEIDSRLFTLHRGERVEWYIDQDQLSLKG